MNSYEDGRDFAYTFDQPMAIIAFTHAGELERARNILDKMKELQIEDPNGPWNEWYRLANSNNVDWDWGSKKYVTGPIAWMVVAVNFYEYRTKDSNYADMARRALRWLDTLRHTDPNDERYGSVRFCGGPRCSAFEANLISTEHNIDAYSAYYWRGILDDNDAYLDKASLILEYLRKQMWGPTPGSNCCRDADVFCRGYNDCVVATDCQSWGVLSLGPTGPGGEEFYKSLYWLLDSPLRTICDYNESITDVDGFKSETNEVRDYVRVDATESVAAAFCSIGDGEWGNYFHHQMGRVADRNGCLVHSFYCDHNDPWIKIYQYNYVASVAWYYFNEVRLNPLSLWPRCWNYLTQCHGDTDNDGEVKGSDFLALKASWYKCYPDCGYNPCADFDRDGCVKGSDFLILKNNWFQPVEPNCPRGGIWPPGSVWPSCWNCPTQCHGDANCDGTVDERDMWPPIVPSMGATYPDSVYDPCYDFNRDGCISGADLLILKANWKTNPPADC